MALMACKGAFFNKLIVHFFINFHQAAYSNGGSSELLLLFIFSFLQSRVFKHSRFIFIQGREICRRPTCQIARSDVLWDIYLSSDGKGTYSFEPALGAYARQDYHSQFNWFNLSFFKPSLDVVRSFVCLFFFLICPLFLEHYLYFKLIDIFIRNLWGSTQRRWTQLEYVSRQKPFLINNEEVYFKCN